MTSLTSGFRAALVQLRTGRDVAANLEHVETLIRQAAGCGAQLILTPENTGLMELRSAKLFANTDVEQGNMALERLKSLARDLEVWLQIGSLAIQVADDKVANRSYLIGPDGGIVARYDKMHMFDVELPGGESYRESKNYSAGGKAVLANLPWGRIGLTICYDLRFPALYRALAHAGADFITVPSAFTKQTGEAHWHTLLKARAIETGTFILAAAQGGMHETGRATFGHSLIISPWGDVIAEAGIDPGVVYADIDRSRVAEARARIPSLTHDRSFDIVAPASDNAMREAS